jgi:hypothetical protein
MTELIMNLSPQWFGWRGIAVLAAVGVTLVVLLTEGRAQARSDQCGAARLQRFVGHPVDRLQRLRPPGGAARYVCRPGCAMTMDYSPDRLTVSYDSATRRIRDVRCG